MLVHSFIKYLVYAPVLGTGDMMVSEVVQISSVTEFKVEETVSNQMMPKNPCEIINCTSFNTRAMMVFNLTSIRVGNREGSLRKDHGRFLCKVILE